MESPPIRLDRIRVQTARMLEIYSLLHGELEKNAHLFSSPEERSQLGRAIDTIRANMRQLLQALTDYLHQSEETQELEEIINGVLEWHMANVEGE